MDLSKAFDTLNHDFLTAKLHAYGFQHNASKLLHSYLSKQWHRTKVNTSFHSWEELIKGIPQVSVLGPVLFNLYLSDLFYLVDLSKVCNFADDTTLHACDNDLNNLIKRLELDAFLAIKWFEINNMNSAKKNVTFQFRGISVKMFGLKWGMKKFGKVRNKNYLQSK